MSQRPPELLARLFHLLLTAAPLLFCKPPHLVISNAQLMAASDAGAQGDGNASRM